MKYLAAILALIISSQILQAQTIRGLVTDKSNNNPVLNASIYFDGTLRGTISDGDGNFEISLAGISKVPLMVSAIGYTTATQPYTQNTSLVVIQLVPKSTRLNEIVISANTDDGMSRSDKIKIFKREFLGDSYNGKNSVIVNPDDIELFYNSRTRTLKASCEVPITILNKSLGYTLRYNLVNFTFSNANGIALSYRGTFFFEEDSTQKNNPEIIKRRDDAYYGSRMQFIRSLWNNTARQDGFDLSIYPNSNKLADDVAFTRDGQKYLNKTKLNVKFGNKRSVVDVLIDSAYIERNGFFDPLGFSWSGNLVTQRIGDMLPFDYKLESLKPVTPRIIDTVAAKILLSIDSIRSRLPIEKLYLQLDKPYYAVGDTLWFKAYLFDAAFLRASSQSGLVYMELANDTGKVVHRAMLPITQGLGRGDLPLLKDEIPEGSYTLRAYTNLQRNFGEDYMFKKDLYISSPAEQSWIVGTDVRTKRVNNQDSIRLGLRFAGLDNQPIRVREMQLRVMDGKRVLVRDNVETDQNGKLDVNFSLAANTDTKNLTVIAEDLRKGAGNRKIPIPIIINRNQHMDLQFMPEGGKLVAGIPGRVGFKALGEDGKGTDVSGKVYNQANQEVISFASSHKGMGSFDFTPQAGETYTAKIGNLISYKLPIVEASGTTLNIENKPEKDSITLSVTSATRSGAPYYLISQARSVVCYAAIVRFSSSTTNSRKIAKNLFPSGIIKFTLLDINKQPLNERIIFINHHDPLSIAITADKESYTTRDSISLNISVTDKTNNPIQGSFSIAITDDGQVKTDSLSNSINTNLLLTSDLKGTIEEPGYYFGTGSTISSDLDNLMLTQGWVGYSWKDIMNPLPAKLKYEAEKEFAVKGRVSNVFNKSLEETSVQLISKKPLIMDTTTTHLNGEFIFRTFPPLDTVAFLFRAKNKNDKTFNVGVEINEFKPPVFTSLRQRQLPWYMNSDSTLLGMVKTKMTENKALLKIGNSKLMNEVTITGKKIIRGSKNLNGPGEADQVLDEKEIQKEHKLSLLDLVKLKVEGFKDGISFSQGSLVPMYTIKGQKLHLVFDGIDMEKFFMPADANYDDCGRPTITNRVLKERYEYLKGYMEFMSGEDIKGIEVMYSAGNNIKYNNHHLTMCELLGISSASSNYAYLEITTYSGNGAFLKKTPGTYLYKPMPFAQNKQFYSPKYTVKNTPGLTDFRSTIYWNPDVVTDENGKAVISFYSADRKGSYTILTEGANMNGDFGSAVGKVLVR